MTALLPIEEHLVSTIIPVYNRAAFLQQAVACVLEQTYRPIQIIISDDGSTDETPTVARDLQRQHPDIVEYVRNDNRGPGPAREAGRQRARGGFIQYLDSDDYLYPEKFADQVKALRDHPECGIAYGITRLTDINGNVLKDPYKWTGEEISALFPKLLADRWWCSHTPLYRRSVCDTVGPWSDLRYSQDWEYDARAGALNFPIVSCHTLVSDHRNHPGHRQTGHGFWLAPADQVRFFNILHTCAHRAKIPLSAPEMHHFSRWVFARARACGAHGYVQEAQQLYALSRKCTEGEDRSMAWTGFAARWLGWQFTGKLCALRDRMLAGGKDSSSHRPLTWNTPDP